MSIDTKISILNANKVNMLTLFALKIDTLYFILLIYHIFLQIANDNVSDICA